MLSREHRQILSSILIARLSFPIGHQHVAPYVGPAIALKLPLLKSLGAYADWMIVEALLAPEPDILILMISKVSETEIVERMESLLDLVETLKSRPETWRPMADGERMDWSLEGDPLVVDGGKPFIDRRTFRELLPRHDDIQTPKCTVVHAERGEGKSYLIEFIRAYAANWDGLKLGAFEVPQSGVWELDPAMIADEIALGIGIDSARRPRKHEDPHRHAKNQVDWLVSAAPQGPVPSLIVLEGLDFSGLPEAVHTFVIELARRIHGEEDVAKNLRLILLGFPSAKLEEEGIESKPSVLEFIGASEISEWLRRRYPGKPEYMYEDTGSVIAESLPRPGPLRLRQLRNKVEVASSQFT